MLRSEAADDVPGRGIIRGSWAGTAVFAASCAVGLVAIDTVAPLVVWLSVAMFVIGCTLFFVAYAVAVGRSRTEALGVGGIYFLADSAPPAVRRHLVGSFAAQCLVVVVVVALRPFTSLVIAALAPMYALGCSGLWGARHGTFPPRAR